MRVLCWNLRGGTDAKWDLITGLEPDIAVLAESARAPRRADGSLFEAPTAWHWVGLNPAKGLAVATFGTSSGVVAPAVTGRWSVAVRQAGRTVLGIWSCPTDGQYAREVRRAVDAHKRWLDPDAALIVAGDFNVDAAAASRRRSGAFRHLATHLASLGLTSAYHEVRGEPFGMESAPTYYHQRNRARPYHIDYCFLSAAFATRASRVEVGTYEEWVEPGHSDRVPVIVELDD